MKLALVTGGCRRLGAAIAARLAADGWSLALHAGRDPVPEPLLAEALAAASTRWQGFAADLGDPHAVDALLPAVTAAFGAAPRLLVNNAAMFGQDDLATTGWDSLTRHFAVNAAAPVMLARAMPPDSAVVNILDQRIRHPHRDQLAYTLSKQALAGATETLARAMAPAVRVNAVAPGLTIPTADYAGGQLDRVAAAMPLARLATPGEVADAVLWLAGAKAVTGQTVFIDGGAHMISFDRDFIAL